MTDGNYQKHCKVLGKYCRLYDTAGTNETAMKALEAITIDQVADGLAASLPACEALAGKLPAWKTAISAGPSALKAVAIQLAAQYLQLDLFCSTLVGHAATAGSAVTTILTAFQDEMSASHDNKTLGTKTTSGLVNFFDAVAVDAGGSAGTWNTESDATADYRDAIYVVDTAV
jgi:hypothetical protein